MVFRSSRKRRNATHAIQMRSIELACIAHGFGKRGLTLSEPISRDVELSWVEGLTPFSETVRNAG